MDYSIIISMFWGIVGIAYFRYGKKQRNSVVLIVGIVLLAFPYFISNLILVISFGFLLAALPFLIKY